MASMNISKFLIISFTVILSAWMHLSRRILIPQPSLLNDLYKIPLIDRTNVNADNTTDFVIENWTKIDFELTDENSLDLPSFSKINVNLSDRGWTSCELMIVNKRHPDDFITLSKHSGKWFKVSSTMELNPGVYSIYQVELDQKQKILKILPRFLSGVSENTLQVMYTDSIPPQLIRGLFYESSLKDRLVVVGFLLLVLSFIGVISYRDEIEYLKSRV